MIPHDFPSMVGWPEKHHMTRWPTSFSAAFQEWLQILKSRIILANHLDKWIVVGKAIHKQIISDDHQLSEDIDYIATDFIHQNWLYCHWFCSSELNILPLIWFTMIDQIVDGCWWQVSLERAHFWIEGSLMAMRMGHKPSTDEEPLTRTQRRIHQCSTLFEILVCICCHHHGYSFTLLTSLYSFKIIW